MTDADPHHALDRLALIERMLAESRTGFDSYAWCFLLYGGGHTIALLWQWYLPHPQWSWPVMMTLCGLVTGAVMITLKRQRQVETRVGHAIGAIWMAFGVGLVVVFAADRHQPLESFFLLYGMAHVASGMAMRFPLQAALGFCWLALAASVLVSGSAALEQWGFLVMAVVGEIGFGAYGMAREHRLRERARVAQGLPHG